MLSNKNPISAAAKANFDAQLAAMQALTSKAFESVAQLIDLNVSAVKTSLEHSAAATQQLFSAKDPQEFFALSAAQTQPNAEKMLEYNRNLTSIASTTRAEFSKVTEAQIAEATHKVSALIDDVAKNAPPGTENAIALFKSAIGNANTSYEQLSKSTKQASEAMEENLTKAARKFSRSVENSTGRAKQ